METEYTCPFNRKCEEVKRGKIIRCRLYCRIVGVDSNTGKDVDVWDCTINIKRTLQLETNLLLRSLVEGQDKLRVESSKGQKIFNSILSFILKRSALSTCASSQDSTQLIEDKK